jgi:hypothetical protein
MYKYIETIGTFRELVKAIPKDKLIKTIQIHHTYKPDYKDSAVSFQKYNSIEKLIRGIYVYHKVTLGWGDIGYNLIITPYSTLWKGRDFNQDPYGIAGCNRHSFAIALIGNFDKGNDTLNPSQLNVLTDCLGIMIDFLGLDKHSCLIYHNEKATKTCPGSGFITKESLIELL